MGTLAAILNKALTDRASSPKTKPKKERSKMNTIKMLKCKLCKESFPNAATFALHVRWQHPKPKQPKEVVTSLVKEYTPEGKTWFLKNHEEKVKLCAKIGTTAALEKHPEWREVVLGDGTPQRKQKFYIAVSDYRRRHSNGAAKSTPKQAAWNAEQFDLVTLILGMPEFKTFKGTSWVKVFNAHPEWAPLLKYEKGGNNCAFKSFASRVADGSQKRPATDSTDSLALVPTNGKPIEGEIVQAVKLLGREWSIPELEQLVRTVQNSLSPIKWCPDCGYPLQVHTKAYTVAGSMRRKES